MECNAETVSDELPGVVGLTITLEGFNAALGPCLTTGETMAERFTVPENPPVLVIVMVREPEDPLLMDNDDELALMIKPEAFVNVAA